jgi:CRP-like cAMP-binding protein
MYRNIIENFIFFKNFKNTEFIVRVILAFKPILALKNDVLVKQGEFIEEIIFVKNGKLSLCISIDKNVYQKATLNNTISKLSSSLVSSHQLKSIQTRTYHLDDFTYSNTKTFRNNIEEDENENVDILKILEIRKNEHFGDILMFLNKRSPLSVKAKTKYCELFYLNKTDAVEISTSFPLIWRKINKISLFNMEQIKRLINKVIKIYYSANRIEEFNNNKSFN